MSYRSKNVLVVEDNMAMNLAICDILEMNGYTVRTASDGMEGLALMKEHRPDVVLCDIMMPRMDGYTLLNQTRSDEQLRTVPFIFLTARSSAQDRRQAKSIGIEDYLIKPVDAQDLLLSISNVLRREEHLFYQAERQAEELRSQIVSALQHEFRTPLTFILGYAELLAESQAGSVDLETLRTSATAILEGGRRLQDMIEKFLLLADMQQRRELPESTTQIDALILLAETAQRFEIKAKSANLAFGLESTPDHTTVLAEPTYVRAALDRLIENAIQYRKPTSSRILLSVVAIDGYLGLQVQDDGRGIPANAMDSLRNPFAQVDRENRDLPGIGLGLAQVRNMARLHGGYLQIESEEGMGSTFTVWLPQTTEIA
ncbi:MAG: response regulator [Caldilineaceae bacterium]